MTMPTEEGPEHPQPRLVPAWELADGWSPFDEYPPDEASSLILSND